MHPSQNGQHPRRSNYKRGGGRRNSNQSRRSRHNSRGEAGVTEEVRGYLSVAREGFGFLRLVKNSLAASKDDVFVPNHFIKRFGLRAGVEIVGTACRKNNRRPLTNIESGEGQPPEDYIRTPEFKNMISEDPTRRIFLETQDRDLSLRVIDLMTPIGFGQRSLIVAPPRTGKTMILQKIAHAVLENHKDVDLFVLLVDERPEEVTDFSRNCVGATVLSSDLDKDASVHVELCEMTLERCRRLVERGRDVVLLIDSLTRMGRAFNAERGKSGRTLSGGLDSLAMQKPRELFGAARCGSLGSLTIIATALVDTGSRMDQVIFEEFKGTGNMELVLRRDLADHRIWPAIDVRESGTRKEEKLRTPDEYDRINLIRRMILKGKAMGAMEGLLKQLKNTQNNAEFLMSIPV